MSWTGKNDLKTLRVDADFFENERKNLRFQKYLDYISVEGALASQNQVIFPCI